MFSRFKKWFSTPQSSPDIDRQNFVNVQIDAIGVGLAGSASPFLPVFLTHLNASNFQIGLLTSMPALTGFLLSLPLGQFLQSRKRIVPWFSIARLAVIASYFLTGFITFFIPQDYLVIAILAVWALATIPQTLLAITFSVVMNAVAGEKGRFELMTRRWSILGLTTAFTVAAIGQILVRIGFPLNFQVVFIGLSIGGLISYIFSNRIKIPDTNTVVGKKSDTSLCASVKNYLALIQKEKPFKSFIIKRFVFLTGINLAAPLFAIYYVRVAHLDESWIAAISSLQTFILVLGYFFWTNQSRRRGSRIVLLCTTLGLSAFPILVAFTTQNWVILILAAFSGIFQAGLDLVFFDELMKTVPFEYSATFVALAQGIQYFSTMIAPTLGTTFADIFGVSTALIIGGLVRLAGFFLFWKQKPVSPIGNA